MYVIDKVTLQTISEPENEEGKRLNKQLLASILGSGVGSQILKNLICWGVLERSTGYQVGKESYKYSLNGEYDPTCLSVYFSLDEDHHKRLKKLRRSDSNDLQSFLRSNLYRLTFDWPHLEYQLQGLGIDFSNPLFPYVRNLCTQEQAEQVTNELSEVGEQEGGGGMPGTPAYVNDFTHSNDSKGFALSKIEHPAISVNIGNVDVIKGLAIIKSLIAIMTGDLYLISNSRLGRVYSNFANLKKELREALVSKESKPIIEVDIKNSQPFFLAILLIGYYKKKRRILPKDVMLYIDLVKKGSLYEHCMEFGPRELTREEAKKKLISNVFFCKNQVSQNSVFFAAFKEQFPTVSDFILESKKEDHRTLSTLLQRAESAFMIDFMGAKMMHRGWLFVTVHDAAIIHQDTLPGFIRYMNEYFADYGILPQLDAGSKHHLLESH
ncbi:MAG: hypothetical protein EP332_04675 [Bacteroidetes bacterium]|nr:MAG: hypothetical protein EP332_04675 [Bacteroidota bacterium]